MNRLTFQDLGLNPSLLKALDKLNYQAPTPIQSQAIPILLEGHDLLATAQTGTGKTASFVLPLLQGLLERQPNLKAPMDPRGTERHSRGRQPNPRREGRGRDKGRQSLSNRNPYVPQALILAPTRELAIQIGESIQGYAQGTAVKHVVIYGGAPQAPQIQKMSKLPQILVATPGRLLAYEEEGIIDLSQIIELVLDEADRMLDMGFIGDVKKVARMTQNREQTLLFSATMPPEIEALGAFLLREPKRVAIAPKEVAVDRIRQSVFHLEQADKLNLLKQVIQDRSMYKVIVFTRTKHRAARVSKVLQKAGIPADAIHGDRNQNQRQRALAGLKSGKVQALVATDVAARGIDVDDVTHVINFEIPHESESYVHRIGRTARAGSDGDALSFCNPEELEDLRAIEKLIGKTLPVDDDHDFHIDPPVKVIPQPKQKKGSQQRRGSKPNAQQRGGQRKPKNETPRSSSNNGQKSGVGRNQRRSGSVNQGSPRSKKSDVRSTIDEALGRVGRRSIGRSHRTG